MLSAKNDERSFVMTKQSAYYHVKNLSGEHDVKNIKRGLDELPGVFSVSVNQENARVAVDFDNTGVSTDQLEAKLHKLGLQIVADSSTEHIM